MSRKLIQIFARFPEPGKVKTRLIPKLGKEGACNAYIKTLAKTIENANLDNINYEVWLDGNNFSKFKDIFNINNNLQLHEQKGINLGNKMFFAINQGLANNDKVVLVGSDCPAIYKKHYVKLFKLLENHDLSLIPALDGGYVAIGARIIDIEIFKDISWGTSNVFQDTISRIKALNLSFAQLEPLRDLDTEEDHLWHLKQKNIQ